MKDHGQGVTWGGYRLNGGCWKSKNEKGGGGGELSIRDEEGGQWASGERLG